MKKLVLFNYNAYLGFRPFFFVLLALPKAEGNPLNENVRTSAKLILEIPKARDTEEGEYPKEVLTVTGSTKDEFQVGNRDRIK